MSISDKQAVNLVKGCIANERSAQEALFKLFYADMLRLCARYLKTDELAKEALNSGFLKIFQNINAFDDHKGELGAWIRTIMVRTCIDLARKEIKFTKELNLTADADDIFVNPTILNKLYAEDLVKHIRLLPAATQMVFNLSVIDGYTHKEIAQQLSITESTSRWHLAEAKKQLRALIEPNAKSTDYLTEKDKKRK
jgi:RNA polymerase sigma factor (sigma-70 family)